MACRVGMSTIPYTRMQHWKDTEGCTHGKIIANELTYDEAQTLEKSEGERLGCRYGEGGERKSGKVYSVYVMTGCK